MWVCVCVQEQPCIRAGLCPCSESVSGVCVHRLSPELCFPLLSTVFVFTCSSYLIRPHRRSKSQHVKRGILFTPSEGQIRSGQLPSGVTPLWHLTKLEKENESNTSQWSIQTSPKQVLFWVIIQERSGLVTTGVDGCGLIRLQTVSLACLSTNSSFTLELLLTVPAEKRQFVLCQCHLKIQLYCC